MVKNWIKRGGIVTMIATTCLLISSCGSNSSDMTSSEPMNKKDTVLIQNMKFVPENITIKKGDTLVFINKDLVKHDVTQKDKTWQSEVLGMNDSYTIVPEHSDEYYCSLHVVMTGQYTVE